MSIKYERLQPVQVTIHLVNFISNHISPHHLNCSIHECWLHHSKSDLLLDQKYLIILNEYKRSDYYYYHKCKWQCVRIKKTDTSNYCHCTCIVIAPRAIYCLQCIKWNMRYWSDFKQSSIKMHVLSSHTNQFPYAEKLNGITILELAL